MMHKWQNPFAVTRAVDLSDAQIVKQWIDLPMNDLVVRARSGTDSLSTVIVGGKGSGKTHLIRFLATSVQLAGGCTAIDLLASKFIGVYLLCEGLNSSRFAGKGVSSEQWNGLFQHYMDVVLAERCLRTVIELLQSARISVPDEESLVSREVVSLFDSDQRIASDDLVGCAGLLAAIRKRIDLAVNQCALTRSLNVPIVATAPTLLFSIPRILTESISVLKGCRFGYLVDEFENLQEVQQKYVNTLIRQSTHPTSLTVGVRKSGWKTKSTFAADEELKTGSEYEQQDLDDLFRSVEESKYSEFVQQLCSRRLALASGDLSGGPWLQRGEFSRVFDNEPSSTLGDAETSCALAWTPAERPWIKRLGKYLAKFYGYRKERVEEITRLVQYAEHPAVERYLIHLIYQKWTSPSLLEVASRNREAADALVADRPNPKFAENFRSWKSDMIALVRKDCRKPQVVGGFDALLRLSHGLPRNFLIIMKHIYSWSEFRGEGPFRSGRVSVESQRLGIVDAADWFYSDACMAGDEGLRMREGMSRIAEMMKMLRYSDKPSEVDLCVFTVPYHSLSDESRKILDHAQKWSLISSVGGRPDKNSASVLAKYQLNPLFAIRWELSMVRRGDLSLSAAEADLLLCGTPEHALEVMQRRTRGLNGPGFRHDEGNLFAHLDEDGD